MTDFIKARAEVFEPDDSYWFHRPALNFPPKAVRHPRDYDGGERLCLSITQTNLSAREQSALVREWCALLPTLANVRTLWFASKVTQGMFEAACAMPTLDGLYVKWSSIDSLSPMVRLQNLRYFHLGGAPSAENLEALAQLPQLVDLEISKVRAAGDLRFLAGLTQLRALDISGDTNSVKALKAKSLAPIACLLELERLGVSAVQLEDESLAPLAGLPRLKYLGLSNRFPMEEFARLAGRRPDISCDRFVPHWGPLPLRCKKCKAESMYLLTGKGTPMVCARCDSARLVKHGESFEAIRLSYLERRS